MNEYAEVQTQEVGTGKWFTIKSHYGGIGIVWERAEADADTLRQLGYYARVRRGIE